MEGLVPGEHLVVSSEKRSGDVEVHVVVCDNMHLVTCLSLGLGLHVRSPRGMFLDFDVIMFLFDRFPCSRARLLPHKLTRLPVRFIFSFVGVICT